MIRYIYALIFSFLWTIVGHIVYPFHLLTGKGLGHWFFRTYGRLLLGGSGIRVAVEGLEQVDRTGRYLVVANHQSLFDIPVCMAALPVETKYFAKRELARIPSFGAMFYFFDHVLVDRTSKRGAVRSLRDAKKVLERWSIVIFPEGTRSLDGKVHTFKTGGLALAAEAGVPILPVAIRGTGIVLPKGKNAVYPGTVHLKVFPPIPPDAAADRKQLAERLETTIRSFIETDTDGGING
ncbi:MAG TPA: lysophospholipid acyltransferase family protein [bacterium]|nr:lysophospholipid acyltransferase family protein [bacterium]